MNFENINTQPSSEESKENQPKNSRRDFIRKTLGFSASVALTKGVTDILPSFEDIEKTKQAPVFVHVHKPITQDQNIIDDSLDQNREMIDWREFKKLKPKVGYHERISPPIIEHLNLPNDISKYGATTFEGKIIRTLRYKNITDAVEEKYNLPSGLLLAMIMEESTGVDLLPNARGDGGFGLCHMQGSTAKEYSLNTFKGCNALVCNGVDTRSCKGEHGTLSNHAGELAQYMKIYAHDRKKLIELDERLHVLLNIDAAGRMIAAGIAGPALSGKLVELGPLRRAIARYAGAYNYENYWKDICQNMKDLNNSIVLEKVEDLFNTKNKNLKINGEHGDFKKYLATCWEQNKNYGLEEYKKTPKYIPNNSAQVKKTYKEYI